MAGSEQFQRHEGLRLWRIQRAGQFRRQPRGRQVAPGHHAPATPGKVLEFRYGISYISVEQARKNLREEIPALGL